MAREGQGYPHWRRDMMMMMMVERKTLGQYSNLSPSPTHLSHTTNITPSRIKCERKYFYKEVCSFIEVRILSVNYVSAYICICIRAVVLRLYNKKFYLHFRLSCWSRNINFPRTVHAHKISDLQFSFVIFDYNRCLCFFYSMTTVCFIAFFIHSTSYEPLNYVKIYQVQNSFVDNILNKPELFFCTQLNGFT